MIARGIVWLIRWALAHPEVVVANAMLAAKRAKEYRETR